MAYYRYNTQTREWSSALGHVWNDNNTASNFPNPLQDVAITRPRNISVEPVGVTNGGFGGSLIESLCAMTRRSDGFGNISQLEPVTMTNGGLRGSLVESCDGPGNISLEPVGMTNGGFAGSLIESCDAPGNISQLEPVSMTNGGFRGSLVEILCARMRGSVPQLNTTQYENMSSPPMPKPDSTLLKIPRGLSPAFLFDSPGISKVQNVEFSAASNVSRNISQLEPVSMTNGAFRGSLVERLYARTGGSIPQLNTTQFENMQPPPMPTPDFSLLKIPRGLSPASLLDSPDISKMQMVEFSAASNVHAS